MTGIHNRGPNGPSPSNTDRKHYKILLRKINPNTPTTHEQIFRVTFKEIDTPLTRINDTHNGFHAFTDKQENIDKLLTPASIKSLRNINLEPSIPPELRAKRSVFVRQLDHSVGSRSTEDLKAELERNHPWLQVREVTKIKHYTHVLKLQLQDTQMANKIIADGLLLFNTRISPHQCSPEKFTHILICYKCYKFNSHITKDCTSSKIVCSECAQEGHIHTDCKSPTKSCLNCHQPHRTFSASCPYRKETIKTIEAKTQQKQQQSENATYAKIVKTTVESTQPKQIKLSSNMDIKLIALILEAHIAALTGKKRFGDTLSESLKLNYDIDTKFPDRDSQEILNIYFDRTDDTTDQQMETETRLTTTDTDDGPTTKTKPKKTKKRHRTTPPTNKDQPPPQRQRTNEDDRTDLPPPPLPQRQDDRSRNRTNSISENRPRSHSITSHKLNTTDNPRTKPDETYYIYMDATTKNIVIDDKTTDYDIYQLLTQGKVKIGVIDRAYPTILIKELKTNKGTTFHRHNKIQLLDHEEYKQRTHIFYLNY